MGSYFWVQLLMENDPLLTITRHLDLSTSDRAYTSFLILRGRLGTNHALDRTIVSSPIENPTGTTQSCAPRQNSTLALVACPKPQGCGISPYAYQRAG